MFSKKSFAVIYGLQLETAQKMLDFDFLCDREASVSAFINPSKNISNHKLFFGGKEILIKSYPNIKNIPKILKNKVDTLINFASFRTAYESSVEAMESKIFKNIVIIAEGMPERQTVSIIEKNKKYNLNIIGPATVGGIKSGEFRIGNTGGSLDNIITSKLYKSGSIGFVSKSGGMSNEMRRVIALRTDGTNTSIALGGDKHNIINFSQVIENYEKNDDIKMIVMLGEIGGRDELKIADMIKNKEIKKPVVVFCIGTINEKILGNVQFGHAGAKSNSHEETATYKNTILKEAGGVVPDSFIDFGDKIEEVYKKISKNKEIKHNNEIPETIIKKLDIIDSRKKTLFTSTVSDERGEELLYNGKKVGEFIKKGSFASVIGNLWLKRDLPDYALEFINMILILLADHGPAVCGANNAIVTARAGNDLKSSLIAGLTTIGPRFGGAIDGVARYFLDAVDRDLNPEDFVGEMKKSGINIPGIGHKVKSKFNPDNRCKILFKMSKKIPSRRCLDFALQVEKLTIEKKPNLILNIDGFIGAMLLDIFESIGLTHKEILDYIDAGIFNAFFILARTTGFIGHIIDQKRLKEGLYRVPWNHIMYTDEN